MQFQASNEYKYGIKTLFNHGKGICKNMNLDRICIQCKQPFGSHTNLICPIEITNINI